VASGVVAQLPLDARRVVVRGTSGSGKTTLARRIAATRGVPHVELDGVFHQERWVPLDDELFKARIAEVAARDEWVVCGNYRQVAPLLLARADTVVLYDLPKRTVMARVVRRTLLRVARREELWNGNTERWRNLFSLDKEVSVIAWAWQTHAARHEEIAAFLAHPPREDLQLVHVASVAQERRLYEGLGGTDAHVWRDTISRSAARWTSA
jgi:adenylate kinase family enzyme